MALDPDQQRELGEAAVRLAKVAGYRNAGTVEFLYEPAERRFAFLEVNTRLQVEHPVTELTTGADLVKLQFHVAAGGRLDGPPPEPWGHAIEARLNAEDPERGFAPAPGTIDVLRWPTGPGIRVDTGVAEGDVIPPEYDSMIAKVIAWGATRDEAAPDCAGRWPRPSCWSRAARRTARSSSTCWIARRWRRARSTPAGSTGSWPRGASTAIATARSPWWPRRSTRTRTAGRRSGPASTPRRPAAVPSSAAGSDDPIDLRHRGSAHRVQVRVLGAGCYRVSLDGRAVEVTVERQGRSTSRLTVGDRTFRVLSFRHGTDHLVDVDGREPPLLPRRRRPGAGAGRRRRGLGGGRPRRPGRGGQPGGGARGHEDGGGDRGPVQRAGERGPGARRTCRWRRARRCSGWSRPPTTPASRRRAAAARPRTRPRASTSSTLETVEGLGPGGSGDDAGGTSPLVVADDADAVVPRRAELRLGRLGAFVAGYDVTAAEAQAVLGAYLRDAGRPSRPATASPRSNWTSSSASPTSWR